MIFLVHCSESLTKKMERVKEYIQSAKKKADRRDSSVDMAAANMDRTQPPGEEITPSMALRATLHKLQVHGLHERDIETIVELHETRGGMFEILHERQQQALRMSSEVIMGTISRDAVEEHLSETDTLLEDIIILQRRFIETMSTVHTNQMIQDQLRRDFERVLALYQDCKFTVRQRLSVAKDLEVKGSHRKSKKKDHKTFLSDLQQKSVLGRPETLAWDYEGEDWLDPLNEGARAQLHGEQRVRDSLYPHVTDRKGGRRARSIVGVLTSTPKVPEYARRRTQEEVIKEARNKGNSASRRQSRRRSRSSSDSDTATESVSPDDSASNAGSHRRPPGGGPPGGGRPPGGGGGPPGGPGYPGGGPPGGPGYPGGGGPPGGPGYPGHGGPAGHGGQGHMGQTHHLMQDLTQAIAAGMHLNYDVRKNMNGLFSGEEANAANAYLNWSESWSRVEQHLQRIGKSPAECLSEMRKTLTKTAFRQIENLQINDSNYEEAKLILHQCYNNLQSLVRDMIFTLLDTKALPTNPSTNDLRTFFSTLSGTRQRFAQLQISDADLATLFFIASFERKLPPAVVKSWRKKVQRFDKVHATPQTFVQLPLESFFQHVLDAIHQTTLEGNTSARPAAQGKKTTQDQKEGRKQRGAGGGLKVVDELIYFATEKTAKNVPCNLCDTQSQHILHSCLKVRAMPVNERWELAKKKKLCVGCQQPLSDVGHPYGKCDVVQCEVEGCGKGHHPFFHNKAWTSAYTGNNERGGFRGRSSNRGGYAGRSRGGFRGARGGYQGGADARAERSYAAQEEPPDRESGDTQA